MVLGAEQTGLLTCQHSICVLEANEGGGGERDLDGIDIAKRREGTCCGTCALCRVSLTMCTVLGSANGGLQTSPFASHLSSPSPAGNPCESLLVLSSTSIVYLGITVTCPLRAVLYSVFPTCSCTTWHLVLSVSINWTYGTSLRRLFQSCTKETSIRISSPTVSKIFPLLSQRTVL